MSHTLFDPERDPYTDIREAIERARDEQKNVLLDLGGDWCIWCLRLEAFIRDHPEIDLLRSEHFITVKLFVGEEDERNQELLEQLPPFDGVPHLMVYNARGQLLCSQATDDMEEGETYSYDRVREFFERWSDPRLTPYDALSTDELRRRFARYVARWDGDGPTLSA